MITREEEITIEEIMKMDLERAYEEVCIIEDDIKEEMSERGRSIKEIQDIQNNIEKIRYGINIKVYIKHLIDKNYLEKPEKEIVIINRKEIVEFDKFAREIEVRRILAKKILRDYYTYEKKITRAR